MNKALVCRTAAFTASDCYEPRPELANPDAVISEVPRTVPEPWRERLTPALARGYALSPRLVCEMFDVSRGAVHNSLSTGELPGFRIGKEWRIRPESIPERLVGYWLAVKRNPYVPPAPEKRGFPTGQIVYFITGAPRFVKIGHTRNLARRVKALQTGCPLEIELLAYVRGGQSLEADYHYKFKAWRCCGEWFRLVPPIQAEIERLQQ